LLTLCGVSNHCWLWLVAVLAERRRSRRGAGLAGEAVAVAGRPPALQSVPRGGVCSAVARSRFWIADGLVRWIVDFSE